MLKRLILFLLLNFGALAVGSLFTADGVTSDWYQGLNKAPWTPPGWVFGSAWTTIMICFSLFMAFAIKKVSNQIRLVLLFSIQWVLNTLWNPSFFFFHEILLGMIIISALTVLIAYMLFSFKSNLGLKSILLLPYFLWLIIATSLNGYILFYN
ncbi:MAG: tryptophan-rich sensory protein [Bacteroidetes bacterium]|nr:tryptophan-rich sensory protein [Bacteroidota bacterium]